MAWTIEFEDAALQELAKLDKPVANRIVAFLRERVAVLDNPRSIGQVLKGSQFGDFWKYHVGDYRIITHFEDGVMRILVLEIGHRREIYR